VTALLALAGVPLFLYLPTQFAGDAGPDLLERPVETAIRLFEGDLALLDAIEGDRWLRELYGLLGSSRERTLREAEAAYLELAWVDDPARGGESLLAPRRAILLLELGERGPASRELDRVALQAASSDTAPAIAWAFALDPRAPEPAGGRAALEALPEGWARSRALARWAERERALGGEDPRAPAGAEAARLRRHTRLLTIAWLAPTLAGVGVLCARALARRRGRPAGPARIPPPWSAGDGLAVALRGFWLYAAISLLAPNWLGCAASALALLALVAWSRRHLVASRPLAALGLGRTGLARAAPLVGFTLAMLAVHEVGSTAIERAFDALGASPHWSEGVLEDLLYLPGLQAAVFTADLAGVAPVFEEALFRGLVYASLRARLGVVAALVASTALFALPHGYSPSGLADVLWGGAVWGFAYERSRSLWPCVAGHVFNNALVAASQLLWYR
jgi:hypothetical protein